MKIIYLLLIFLGYFQNSQAQSLERKIADLPNQEAKKIYQIILNTLKEEDSTIIQYLDWESTIYRTQIHFLEKGVFVSFDPTIALCNGCFLLFLFDNQYNLLDKTYSEDARYSKGELSFRDYTADQQAECVYNFKEYSGSVFQVNTRIQVLYLDWKNHKIKEIWRETPYDLTCELNFDCYYEHKDIDFKKGTIEVSTTKYLFDYKNRKDLSDFTIETGKQGNEKLLKLATQIIHLPKKVYRWNPNLLIFEELK
jgi:hypothetical protein